MFAKKAVHKGGAGRRLGGGEVTQRPGEAGIWRMEDETVGRASSSFGKTLRETTIRTGKEPEKTGQTTQDIQRLENGAKFHERKKRGGESGRILYQQLEHFCNFKGIGIF